MYVSPVPLMAVRADSNALISVNGRMLGECTDKSYVSMPIADSGDYYVSAAPLTGGSGVVTRRLHIENGLPAGELPPDVSVYVWPGGVLDFVLHTGVSAEKSEPPCLIVAEADYLQYSLSLCSGEEMQLYAERGSQPFCRYLLGAYDSGEFIPYGEHIALLLRGARTRLLLFDRNLQVSLDLRGSAAFLEDAPICIEELPTLLRHERRTRYTLRANVFQAEKPELGFFTREAPFPSDTLSLAIAFFEAVREGFAEEALLYLSPALRKDLEFYAIRDFFGPFSQVRVPFADQSGRLIGICDDARSQASSIRLYHLSFEDGLIANIAEEE